MKNLISIAGKLMDLSTPKIMGIINITPDSFYDKSRAMDNYTVLKRIEQMLIDGADIIDLGAMSSRPGAELIDEETELKRLIPILKVISTNFPSAVLSIDTIRASVAEVAINVGAHIINDITGGHFDSKMLETVGNLGVPFICMHSKGLPKEMQLNPNYNNILVEIIDYFIERLSACHLAGIKDVIIDPGFGFGKTIEHNYTLLKQLNSFSFLNVPILVGLSRKSMIYKPLEISIEESLPATTALHLFSLQNGAKILRVHDVKAAKQAIDLFHLLA
ncbi:MAG: dihydropteroate synthase [Bacteroidetes bacterium]|nr:dihydropteroate synthase [Bacteroidota bacterium]